MSYLFLSFSCSLALHEDREDKNEFAALKQYESAAETGKLNAFSERIIKSKKFLTYPKAAEKVAQDVLDMVEKGKFCEAASPSKAFEKEMKAKSKDILEYINYFTWTIDWDSRDYHPDSP